MRKIAFGIAALLLVMALLVPGYAQDLSGSITAHKFNDRNGNGVQDAGEEDLGNWLMSLYAGSGCVGSEMASGMTNSSGNVIFQNLCHAVAPSILAASISVTGIVEIPAT